MNNEPLNASTDKTEPQIITPLSQSEGGNPWPALPLADWAQTRDTVHLWTQMAGKVKLAASPFQNHWWQVALTLTPRGLTTGTLPYPRGAFSLEFDLLADELRILSSRGWIETIPLVTQTVSAFYGRLIDTLQQRGITLRIDPTPAEILDAIPFDRDQQHGTYDAEAVRRWWRILLSVEQVFRQHNASFAGKSSPVLFYWGSFDLALARYSGRTAPFLEKAPRFVALAEDRENVACGFWPGNTSMSGVTLGEPAFYSYVYPEPPGFRDAKVAPDAAFYHQELNQFILPYEAVRISASPEETLLQFLRSTYAVAATHGSWDQDILEIDYPEVKSAGRREI
ncbi:MAG: DUF5996 family protein [Chloroflexota bacterium]